MAGTWPIDIKREKETLESIFFTFVNRTQSGQRNVRSGERHMWRMKITTPLLTRSQYQKLTAFAVKQQGRYDTFTVVSSMFKEPLGNPSGTGLVNGATNAGVSTISTDGWTANNNNLFKAGDLIKFANHKKVYMLVEDAISNGSGAATLTFKPSLVSPLTDNEAIIFTDVPFTVAFAKDPFPIEGDVTKYAKFEIELEEVWNS